VRERGSIAVMPAGYSFEQAAAVCDGLMLANNYIRRIAFQEGTRILVNGATGSIGSAAVQLAKYFGAEVTATCKTAAIAQIRALGADMVIDYTKEDFTKLDRTFDVVLDSVGKSTFFECRRLLKPGGTYFSSELGPYWQNPLLALITPLFGGKKVGFPIPTDSQDDIHFFRRVIEEGKYQAVIDRTYPLEQVVEATRYVETGEKTGNVVMTVGPAPTA
jgi:NADPH:quinone reductase-like Zn-dependent oxidoreductase